MTANSRADPAIREPAEHGSSAGVTQTLTTRDAKPKWAWPRRVRAPPTHPPPSQKGEERPSYAEDVTPEGQSRANSGASRCRPLSARLRADVMPARRRSGASDDPRTQVDSGA